MHYYDSSPRAGESPPLLGRGKESKLALPSRIVIIIISIIIIVITIIIIVITINHYYY